jgi:hypothetical protein
MRRFSKEKPAEVCFRVDNMLQHDLSHLKWLLFSCIVWLAFCGCGKEGNEPADVPGVPESFQFMDIGANTVMDSKARDRLRAALGSDAISRRSTIDLELRYKGFLEKHYPDLAMLNQRLNVSDVVRKEYPATKLTFRNPRQRNALFDYVEIICDDASGCPLLVKMIAKKEIPDLIRSVEDKYGLPQKIPVSEGKSWSLSWRKNNDVFVIARIVGRYDRPEHHMLIVYTNRLEQLLARSAKEDQKRGKPAAKIF